MILFRHECCQLLVYDLTGMNHYPYRRFISHLYCCSSIYRGANRLPWPAFAPYLLLPADPAATGIGRHFVREPCKFGILSMATENTHGR